MSNRMLINSMLCARNAFYVNGMFLMTIPQHIILQEVVVIGSYTKSAKKRKNPS